MTTNKTEVKRYAIESGYDSAMRKINRMRESKDGYYVHLADYEALQAECEKLRKDASQYRRLIELGEDFQWENIIRVDISDFPSRSAAIARAALAAHRKGEES